MRIFEPVEPTVPVKSTNNGQKPEPVRKTAAQNEKDTIHQKHGQQKKEQSNVNPIYGNTKTTINTNMKQKSSKPNSYHWYNRRKKK
jgi:hypothetical protein